MNKTVKALLITFACVAVVAGGIFAYAKIDAAKPVTAVRAGGWLMSYMPNQSWLYGVAAGDGSQTETLSADEKLLELYVSEGDTVNVGDPLFKLDSTKKELELKEKQLKLARLELQLQEDYKTYKKYARAEYENPLLTPTPKPTKNQKTGSASRGTTTVRLSNIRKNSVSPDSGSGTESDPYVFKVKDGTGVTAELVTFLKTEAANKDRKVKAILKGTEMQIALMANAAGEVCFSVSVTGGGTEGNMTSPVSGNGYAELPFVYDYPNGEEVTFEFISNKLALAAKRKSTVYTTLKNDRFLSGISFGADGSIAFTVKIIAPTPTPTPTSTPTPVPSVTPEITPTPYSGGGLSKDEREELTQEALTTILKDELSYRQLQLDIQNLEKTVNSCVVYSNIAGTVTLANADAEAGDSIVKIQSGTGVYVACVIGETDRDTYTPGTVMAGYSYDSGETVLCSITSVDDTPLTESYSNGGNPNSSAYIARLEVIGDYIPSVDEYIEFTSTESLADSGVIYLFEAFISEEDGGKYLYVVRDGIVRREAVTTGAIVQRYVEIKGIELTEDDYIVFPGEPRCRDGATAELSTESYYYYG